MHAKVEMHSFSHFGATGSRDPDHTPLQSFQGTCQDCLWEHACQMCNVILLLLSDVLMFAHHSGSGDSRCGLGGSSCIS